MSDIGDRMKRYELVSNYTLINRMPVIVRVDGRAFHSFCRGLNKPFDEILRNSMWHAGQMLAGDMQGFRLGYVQSDEASFFLSDYDKIHSQPWFGNDLSKIVSISASRFTSAFNDFFHSEDSQKRKIGVYANFDARAFNIPENDVANYFLWRALDWQRNSISMYARSFFSHKQLHGKGREDMHEMLHSIGKNWTKDLSPHYKNGVWLIRGQMDRCDITPSYEEISKAIEESIPVEEKA